MSKETWQCGDCGTTYSSKVTRCTNTEGDNWGIEQFQRGYRYGIQKSEDSLSKFKKALRDLDDLGFEVTLKEKK